MSDVRGLRRPSHQPASPALFRTDERSVLIAALGNGPQARSALERVATSADLDCAPISVIRLAPLLVERAKAARLDTPNVSRLWGVVRHQWIASRLRLRLLAELAAELDESVPLAAMKGAALVARDGAAARTRSMGDIDILVPRKAAMTVIKALVERGFHSSVIDVDAMTPADVRALHGAGLQRQRHEECDVHWYPLRRLRSDALTTAILHNREMIATPHGPLPVVAAADHLFLLLANAPEARSEQRFEWPADVAALLAAPASIEWSRLRWLAARTQIRAELRADV